LCAVYLVYTFIVYFLWIGEIFWTDLLNYNVYHKGEMEWDLGAVESGIAREESDKGDEDGEQDENEQDEWQDEWQDTRGDGETDGDESTSEEVERPCTPPQQIGVESERVDSVVADQLGRGKGISTAWDDGASPEMRNRDVSPRGDEFVLE
jgi:hypothetical protein